MKPARLNKYLRQKPARSTNPIETGEEVRQNPDPKIDEDHPGFPDGPSSKELIKPKTATQKKTAAVDVTDGEKVKKPAKKQIDEQASDGSANAFDGK